MPKIDKPPEDPKPYDPPDRDEEDLPEVVEIAPLIPKPLTAYIFGMSKWQNNVMRSIAVSHKDQPFTIGMFCEKAQVDAEKCIGAFKLLHAIGVLRCPVNDGGCALYQLVPELARRMNARTDR